MKILLSLLVLASLVSPAAAQRRDTSWTRSSSDPLMEASPRLSASQRVARRTLSGFAGTLVGGVAGATIGYQATYRGDGGEDPGLDGLIVGGIIGGAVGATVGAALPAYGARCSRTERVARGLAATGALAAAFLTTTYVYKGGEVVIAFPFATPLVAAVATNC